MTAVWIAAGIGAAGVVCFIAAGTLGVWAYKRKPRCPQLWDRGGIYRTETWTCALPAGHNVDHEWRAPR